MKLDKQVYTGFPFIIYALGYLLVYVSYLVSFRGRYDIKGEC